MTFNSTPLEKIADTLLIFVPIVIITFVLAWAINNFGRKAFSDTDLNISSFSETILNISEQKLVCKYCNMEQEDLKTEYCYYCYAPFVNNIDIYKIKEELNHV